MKITEIHIYQSISGENCTRITTHARYSLYHFTKHHIYLQHIRMYN